MADRIIVHPAARFRREVEELSDPDTSNLVRLFIAHLDAGVDRGFLAAAVSEGRFSARASGQVLLDLIAWGTGKLFVREDEQDDPLATDAGEPELSLPIDPRRAQDSEWREEIMMAAFREGQALSALEKAYRERATFERFPNFPPSWGLDTASWSKMFGPHDPIPEIDFHLAASFAPPDETDVDLEYSRVLLGDEDMRILESIVDALSEIPWKVRIDDTEMTVDQKARALRTAIGLPEEGGPMLSLTDPDLAAIIGLSPSWIVGHLIAWWGRQDFRGTKEKEQGGATLIAAQVEVIYRIMVRHLLAWREMSDHELEDDWSVERENLEGLPDYQPLSADSYESLVDAFWEAIDDWDDTMWFRKALATALYRARVHVFRNRFPFGQDAILPLADLIREPGYWLADFASWKDSPDQIFGYLSYATQRISADPWIGRLQLVERARQRKATYEAALEEMIDDGNIGLARAWWAFFMASQSQMFAGFGLGSRETRDVIRIAEGLLPDETIERAFAFVRVMADDVDDPLDRAIMLDLLPRRAPGVEIVPLPAARADGFLVDRISEEIWDRLDPLTRKDLKDAEALWTRSFREMGAGRADWGGLGLLYVRSIEREMKGHLSSLITVLRDTGLAKGARRDTIGSIRKALEDARSALDARQVPIPDLVVTAVHRLDDAFRGELGVITAVRNRAAHGDRDDPVMHVEFIGLRSAIFDHGAFRTIVECGGVNT